MAKLNFFTQRFPTARRVRFSFSSSLVLWIVSASIDFSSQSRLCSAGREWKTDLIYLIQQSTLVEWKTYAFGLTPNHFSGNDQHFSLPIFFCLKKPFFSTQYSCLLLPNTTYFINHNNYLWRPFLFLPPLEKKLGNIFWYFPFLCNYKRFQYRKHRFIGLSLFIVWPFFICLFSIFRSIENSVFAAFGSIFDQTHCQIMCRSEAISSPSFPIRRFSIRKISRIFRSRNIKI